jgi:hypothetical protein
VPAVLLAVKVDEAATPLASVMSVSVGFSFANVPLAPEDGAVKVTCTPLVGIPPVVTVTTSGAENALPVFALCPVPLVAAVATIGTILELELLQLARRPEAKQTKAARMLG